MKLQQKLKPEAIQMLLCSWPWWNNSRRWNWKQFKCSHVSDRDETTAEGETGSNSNVGSENSHDDEFAFFPQIRSCNKNIKSKFKHKFYIAWNCLLTILGKSTNLNHEDNIIPYYDLDGIFVHQLTKHLYGNKYKMYFIRFAPWFHWNKSSCWRCSIKKAVLKHFAIFTEKPPVLESIFNKVAGLTPCYFFKTDFKTDVFLRNF